MQDFREKRAFSIEEVIGASLLISIAVSCFGELNIFGFGIRNILSILIVMILGWKNGILVGTTSGVTIVGFALGNVILAYVSNGYTVELIHFKEILIASIGLLAIPKTVHIDIEEFMGNGEKLLPIFQNRGLNQSKETAEKLNNVSQTIQEMANTYKNQAIKEENEEIEKNDKDIFIAELLDSIEPYKENMLYDDMANTEGKIVDDIFNLLMDKQEITKEDLLNIFAKNNSYIISTDDEKISKNLENNIMQIVRSVNTAFKISKTNFVWMKKIEENKKNMEAQLKGVSKAISGIAKNLEEDIKKQIEYENEKKQITDMLKLKSIAVQEIAIKKQGRFLVELYLEKNQNTVDTQTIEKIVSEVLGERIVVNQEACIGSRINLISDDKYIMALGIANVQKAGNEVSGDSIINTRLKDGKYLVAISDGMGAGEKAKESSKQALKMLENLLMSGFDKETSLELINTSLINKNDEIFATLDIAIVDLYQGTVEMIKSGACPTYFKNKKKVQVIKSKSLPAGMINELNLEVFDKDIENKEIMLMCTDGILDSNVEYKNKELWVKYLLEDIETTSVQKIADLILNEAVDNSYGVTKDDMSLIVCKLILNKN